MAPARAIRHQIEWLALGAAARAVPHLTRRSLLALASLLGRAAYHLDRKGRAVALENLRVAFGDSWDEARRRRVARGAYQTFARTFLDLFWSPNLARRAGHGLLRSAGRRLDDVAKPAVWVTAHFGNFEWLALSFGAAGRPFYVVAQDFKNPALTPIFSALRSGTGHTVIPRERALVRLLKHLAGGGEAAFLCDLTVRPARGAAVIRCFGRRTCVTALHGLLAARTGLPVVPAYSIPAPDGTYTHWIGPAIDARSRSPEAVAQECWDVFEGAVREHPECWMWMYKHWRYLPAGAAPGDYPGYANRSRAFDKLLNSLLAPGRAGPAGPPADP